MADNLLQYEVVALRRLQFYQLNVWFIKDRKAIKSDSYEAVT